MRPAFQNVFLAFCAAALAGCAGMVSDPGADITRAVKLVGPSQSLLLQAEETLGNVSGIDIVPEDNFAELTLILREGGQASGGLFTNKPPIVGILRQQQEPSFVRLSYNVLDNDGQRQAAGEVVGIGEDKAGYFPSLQPRPTLKEQQEALSDALGLLAKEIRQDLATIPLTTTVSTQIAGSQQVAAPVYMHVGLTPKHEFTVAGQPGSELQFVGLTRGLDGAQTHALLKVTKGPLPDLGAKLILK